MLITGSTSYKIQTDTHAQAYITYAHLCGHLCGWFVIDVGLVDAGSITVYSISFCLLAYM